MAQCSVLSATPKNDLALLAHHLLVLDAVIEKVGPEGFTKTKMAILTAWENFAEDYRAAAASDIFRRGLKPLLAGKHDLNFISWQALKNLELSLDTTTKESQATKARLANVIRMFNEAESSKKEYEASQGLTPEELKLVENWERALKVWYAATVYHSIATDDDMRSFRQYKNGAFLNPANWARLTTIRDRMLKADLESNTTKRLERLVKAGDAVELSKKTSWQEAAKPVVVQEEPVFTQPEVVAEPAVERKKVVERKEKKS